MYIELKQQIDNYIEQWCSEGEYYPFAFDLGEFILYFLDYIETLEVTEATKRKHYSNGWTIGYLESNYGYRKKFFPKILMDGPYYDLEFKRMFSDSKYAIQSYNATWNKLHKYVENKMYLQNHTCLKYVDEENQIMEMERIVLEMVNYLEKIDQNIMDNAIINYSWKLICNYIDYEDRVNDDHYIDQMKECLKNSGLIKKSLGLYQTDKYPSVNRFITELENIEEQLKFQIANM